MWFDDNKGYGFIRSKELEEGQKDIFFHWTSIQTEDSFKTVCYGQSVSFELVDDSNYGIRADCIKLLPNINKETGKPLLLAAILPMHPDITLPEFQMVIGSKENRGVKYLYINSDIGYILALDHPLSEFTKEQLESIASLLYVFSDCKSAIIQTGDQLVYDILRV